MKKILLLIITTISIYASGAFITVEKLKEHLNAKNLVILDITDSKTFQKGHIPNAINVNVMDFRKQVGKYQLMKDSKDIEKIIRSLGINNNSKVIIYGHGKEKELLKASYTALSLILQGLDDVALLDGNFEEWQDDYEKLISTKLTPVKMGDFNASFNSNVLVDLNYVKQNIGKKDIIESRPKRFFTGEACSAGVRRLGHIPTASSSFWKNKFDSDETVKDDEDLNKIFIGKQKLDPKKEVIVYCTGGLEASMNWFLLSRQLGFEKVKLYDASMREWGNRDDTPLKMGSSSKKQAK